MTVADTTLLVAALDTTHDRHEEALERLQGLPVLHVPSVVIAELSLVLRRLAKDQGLDGNRFARRALKALLSKHEVQEHQRYDAQAAFELYEKKTTLSYPDAVGIVTAWSLDEALATLDARQARIHGAR